MNSIYVKVLRTTGDAAGGYTRGRLPCGCARWRVQSATAEGGS